jgi:hypothetical protein
MIDTTTKKRLVVSTDGGAGPYLMLPVAQLDEVVALLDANKVSYWVDEDAISLDGKPEITVINFGDRVEAIVVQRLLDGIP